MSERRDRRRLHARARALGVPIEQAVRRPAPTRPARLPAAPDWPRTEMPERNERNKWDERNEWDERDDARAPTRQLLAAPPAAVCCTVTRTREVLDGGTVVLLTRHSVDCPVWSAR
ncbi:hypothetical protein P3T36_003848 [Kitasatospora sp. MAP12-15]|uniref:hypothetical protein n=1 Tax=unclassified Kitasatospora TaxID=2633591 RepID=UPI002475DDDA|nr:hypothetical protein [Kitasatospora sp. MAP12-44]MDH6108508.1 hypothetical protein [Kitasatospora sp. MAP12-44]